MSIINRKGQNTNQRGKSRKKSLLQAFQITKQGKVIHPLHSLQPMKTAMIFILVAALVSSVYLIAAAQDGSSPGNLPDVDPGGPSSLALTPSPGIVITGNVRLDDSNLDPNDAGLEGVEIYMLREPLLEIDSVSAFAADPDPTATPNQSVLIAITDTNGDYDSGFIAIQGDEKISVWARNANFRFVPEIYSWDHYYGYEQKQIDFLAYPTNVTITPTNTTTFTPPPTFTFTPTPINTLVPGLVIYGQVNHKNRTPMPGLSGVDIYMSLASYPGRVVAVTDELGYYRSSLIYIPGDETIHVWAENDGYRFEPVEYTWRHYAGYEEQDLSFTAFPDGTTVTPTFTPSATAAFTPTSTPTVTATPGIIPPNFKIAFIADTTLNSNTRALLELIKNEGSDMILQQGDIDNSESGSDSPQRWDQMITDILGANFPIFATIGNHDVRTWDGSTGFQALLQARLNRIQGAECIGDIGVKAACSYKGFFFIQSGVGIRGGSQEEHTTFIQEQFSQDDHIWHVCSWHKNMRKMQLGDKADETGWGVYEACREAGALIATGHEHSYGRTYLMANFAEQTIQNRSSHLVLRVGQSFAFHNGLGGHSIRNQSQDWPWFAVAYTADQNANFGALFCTFNDNGNPNHASCYFKDVAGVVADQFELVSNRNYNPTSSFVDVPTSHPYFPHIEKLFELGYVAGVSEKPRTYGFNDMLREHMAVHITRGVEGSGFIPTIEPSPISPFDDVAEPSNYSFKWIDWLKKNGFTSGCNPEGALFCPTRNQTMAEYSVYLYRMEKGAKAIPPEPTAEDYARFTDLPHDWRGKWLTAGWKLGIYPHCGTSADGKFSLCPDRIVDRGIAAYMLVLAKEEISTE